MDTTRSPMDNLYKMLSGFSAGHDKALKQGIYNALALFLLCIVSVAGYGLYIILSPFVKPLVWALLCGSVLFPFKCSLATAVQSWFDKIESSHKPLALNIALLPIQIIDQTSELLGSMIWNYVNYIIATITTSTVLLGGYYYTPSLLSCSLWRILMVFNAIFSFFISTCNIYMIGIISIGYLSALYVYWTPENSKRFQYSSYVLWLMISLYLSNIFGTCQVLVFVTLQLLYLAGFAYEVLDIMEIEEANGKTLTFAEATCFALTNNTVLDKSKDTETTLTTEVSESVTKIDSPVTEQETINKPIKRSLSLTTKLDKKSLSLDPCSTLSSTNTLTTRKLLSSTNNTRDRYLLRRLKSELRMSLDTEDNKVDSGKYMYGALYACIGMLLWKHKWIVHMLVIPLGYYMVKKTGSYFGFWSLIQQQYQVLMQIIRSWCTVRHPALLPANIRGLYKVSIVIDKQITKMLKGSVDAVATAAVILGLLVFTTCTSIFISIQVYAEGMHLIQMTGEILNSSLVNNPDIDWVPEKWEESINSVLDNAYTYGRTAISDGISRLVKDLEPAKAEQMEKKVLELWDRLYQAWMMSDESPDLIGPTVDITAAYSVLESFKDSFGKMPLQLFNMTSIQNFAKENVGILMSVLDSLWAIVKGNMSVILSLFTELVYIVLMSGSAVLNFTLSMVVFFTTLFYLLSSSGMTYKPIELTTLFSPINCHSTSHVQGFAMALQESVIGVFAATFKLASFFGMWTWFIHNLFQVKIVYLPSAFATILGAVPFLDAYFACIPATIELWFTKGSVIAILFFMFHFMACNIVVSEFYKEIKGGGHPYLTGLSIAGGIFCLGVEGAIFGPLLLCCIMVAINLSRRYLHSPSEDVINTYSQIQKGM